MKKAIVFILLAGLASLANAQSLAGLARIEKARRLSLAGRRGPIVTNEDLLKVKIRPAVEVTLPEEGPAMGETSSGEPLEGEAAGASELQAPAVAGAQESSPAPAEAADAIPGLREKLRATEELIDLLKTKITALNQDYAGRMSASAGEDIARQLAETLRKLQAAQAEAVRIEREIGRADVEKRISRNLGR